MKRGGSVYILTNISNDVLYIGVTANLFFCLKEHKDKKYPESFTAKYNCIKLAYYENFTTIDEAIAREKQLKNWHRLWNENLIMSVNPTWKDCLNKLNIEDVLSGDADPPEAGSMTAEAR